MKKVLFNISIALFGLTSFGQSQVIATTVIDQSKIPIPGVTVLIEGTEKGTQTDFDGKFSIEVEKGQNLLLSYIGFKTKRIKHKNIDNSTIELREDVTICFVSRDYYLPFKIYDVPTENFNTQQDVFNAIRGKVPGVQISNTNLNQSPKITMRGDDHTIVIVDGVRFDASILSTINPQDIEKIEVATGIAASNYLLNNRN